jgi:hypothetical protein
VDITFLYFPYENYVTYEDLNIEIIIYNLQEWIQTSPRTACRIQSGSGSGTEIDVKDGSGKKISRPAQNSGYGDPLTSDQPENESVNLEEVRVPGGDVVCPLLLVLVILG